MVRVADEIVDADWEGINPLEELDTFEANLFEAIRIQYSSNPISHAFQWAVHTYNISPDYIRAFFKSMRFDTEVTSYNEALYHEYIYGSAEVIGLMSLAVFCRGDEAQQSKLEVGARALGAAFQKVNFLRDIDADAHIRGRIYFPGVTEVPLTLDQKTEIEADIKKDFAKAEEYIQQLPTEARAGVRLAYLYYHTLFEKIQAVSPSALEQRISVSPFHKIALYLKARFL